MNRPLVTYEKVLVIYNPISSGSSSEAIASKFGDSLSKQGHVVVVAESEKKMNAYKRMFNEIDSSDLVVVVGGDGTIRKLLWVLSQTGTPVYVVPAGNESLFARYYKMNADPSHLLQAIAQGKNQPQHFGYIEGDTIKGKKPFFIMASMGLDSLTVKQIGKRRGPVNDWIYIRYGLSALWSLHHPVVSISVDGNSVIERQMGFFIIANSPAYAKDLRVVPSANPSEKSLVVGFLPNAGRYHELTKAVRILQKRPVGLPLQYFCGEDIALILHEPTYPLQVDGDYFRNRDIKAGHRVYFRVSSTPIFVLS